MVFQIHQTHLAWQQPTWSVCRSFFHFSCLVVKTKGVVHFFLLLPHWQHTDKNKLSTEELKIAYPGDCSVIHRPVLLALLPWRLQSGPCYQEILPEESEVASSRLVRSSVTVCHFRQPYMRGTITAKESRDPLETANLATAEQKILCSVLIRILHRKHSTV